MARPDNMTTTTPVDADKWPNRYTQADATISVDVDALQRLRALARQRNADAACSCPPGEAVETCEVHGPGVRWAFHEPLTGIEGELAETCRVLTELAQQLTDALHAITSGAVPEDIEELIEDALTDAAELGITPTHQP